MTAKEHLQSVFTIKEKIKRLNRRREDLRNDMYSIGSPPMAPDHVQSSTSEDRMLKLIARVDEVERDIVAELIRLTDQKQEIIEEIERVPEEKYKRLLFDRYVMCEKWEKIAVSWDKGIRWIQRIHGKALISFEKVWNDH